MMPLGLLALESSAQEMSLRPGEEDARAEELSLSMPLILEGIVLGPDRAPAVGAVVVTSAGGKAVTDQDGSYRLEVHAPLEAESVQVTAVARGGAGSLAASTSVGLFAARITRVGPLVLASSTTCQPSWLPTFGGLPG